MLPPANIERNHVFETVTRSFLGDNRPLRVGEIVEIRPLAEIVATLDDAGRLDGMPFMPEMAAYCGQRATVVKRAHKTCDGHANLRWLDDTVHLDGLQRAVVGGVAPQTARNGLRCDGSAHGRCQAKCLIYWKTSWLKRVADNGCEAPARTGAAGDDGDLLARLGPTTREAADGTVRYTCQATEVNAASRPLPATELKQYLWDVSSGNCSLRTLTRVMAKIVFNRYQRWSTKHLPPALRIREGRRLNHVQGQGTKTPKQTLDLKVGERVRIRPLPDIEATLNRDNLNRGLLFDTPMDAFCGSSTTVLDRVERFVDDLTGEMMEMRSDCLILDGVACTGEHRRLCSRGLIDYWREIWLERETD